MNVTPDSSRGRFWVESRSEPGHSHLVDLTANGGKGECGCENWKFRCQPAIRDGKSMRCAHIDAVREFLSSTLGPEVSYRDRQIIINRVIQQWIEEEQDGS